MRNTPDPVAYLNANNLYTMSCVIRIFIYFWIKTKPRSINMHFLLCKLVGENDGDQADVEIVCMFFLKRGVVACFWMHIY